MASSANDKTVMGEGPAAATTGSPLLEVSEKQKQEDLWKQELLQLEKEIQTLKSVLTVKCAEASELRSRLGISSIQEFKEDIKTSYKSLQESEVVQKTNAALKSFGDFASKKFGELKNSSAVKTIEDKVGGAYTSVKQRLSSTGVADGSSFPQPATLSSNLYSPTTTIDPAYEVIEDFDTLNTPVFDKTVSTNETKKE